jgi:hypothetical protein
LKTKKGVAFHQKSDIFKGLMWYSYASAPNEFIPLKIDRVKEVIAINEKGKEVEDLLGFRHVSQQTAEPVFENVVGQDDLTRFDKDKSKKPKGKKRRNKRRDKNKPSSKPSKP